MRLKKRHNYAVKTMIQLNSLGGESHGNSYNKIKKTKRIKQSYGI